MWISSCCFKLEGWPNDHSHWEHLKIGWSEWTFLWIRRFDAFRNPRPQSSHLWMYLSEKQGGNIFYQMWKTSNIDLIDVPGILPDSPGVSHRCISKPKKMVTELALTGKNTQSCYFFSLKKLCFSYVFITWLITHCLFLISYFLAFNCHLHCHCFQTCSQWQK